MSSVLKAYLLYISGVKLIFVEGHIRNMVALKRPHVIITHTHKCVC